MPSVFVRPRKWLYYRYDNFVPPAQVEELSLLYIEDLVLHSQLHPCLPSTGGVGKVSITKVRGTLFMRAGDGRGVVPRWGHSNVARGSVIVFSPTTLGSNVSRRLACIYLRASCWRVLSCAKFAFETT